MRTVVPSKIGRRNWLAAVLGMLASGPVRADDDLETAESREAEKHARELGLKPFHSLGSKHFIAVGNASEHYMRIALRDCEAVARDYMDHFTAKGFSVSFPDQRMTAVVLEDERAFAQFLGKPIERPKMLHAYVAGVFQRKTNALVLQDFRNVARSGTGIPAWAMNLETLAHEATHQLTFNTGLLNRLGDVPKAIVEGLASYGEVRRPDRPSPPGQINHACLRDLAHRQRKLGWIPVSQLITEESRQTTNTFLLYAQGWLLVHFLMSNPDRTPGFRKYLQAIQDRTDAARRLDDARAQLGDLDKLDAELKRYSFRLLREK